jgi:hypothetical protein
MSICKPQAPRDRCIAGQREAFSFGGTGSVGPWFFRRGSVGAAGESAAWGFFGWAEPIPPGFFVGGTGSVGPWIFRRGSVGAAGESTPWRFFGRAEPIPPGFSLEGPALSVRGFFGEAVSALRARARRGDSSDGRSPSLRYSSDRRSRSLQGRSVVFARRIVSPRRSQTAATGDRFAL